MTAADVTTVRTGNGAGFLGDNLDAPCRLVEGTTLDYLTLEYLAELTMSILARVREKDPSRGYADDFITVLGSLTPSLKAQSQLRVITNGGGVTPGVCAAGGAVVLDDGGLGDTKIGMVRGDALLPRLAELQAANCELRNLETCEPLSSLS